MKLQICRLSSKRAILQTREVDVLFFEGVPIAAKLNRYNYGIYSAVVGKDAQAYLRAKEWLQLVDVEKTKQVDQERMDNLLSWNGAIMLEFEDY